jgi:chromosome segregation ATPase
LKLIFFLLYSNLQHLNAEQAYELQVSNLTRCVANLEDNLRQTDDDKNTLLNDLTAVRELCSRLEGTKESLQRQLTALTIDKEQVCLYLIGCYNFLLLKT